MTGKALMNTRELPAILWTSWNPILSCLSSSDTGDVHVIVIISSCGAMRLSAGFF
jgi:hypothetical protein